MKYDPKKFTWADGGQLEARRELREMHASYPASPEEMERSLPLFLHSGQLARMLAVAELYQRIVTLPGAIFDVGTWRGATAVLCENLRAVTEPLNFQRIIVALDTFEGYLGIAPDESRAESIRDGSYAVEEGYDKLLERLLVLHERANAMGHVTQKHRVVKGDCRETIKQVFHSEPGMIVALAFFDLNAYEPTRAALDLLLPRMVPGGILAFWQLARKEITAEGRVYREVLLGRAHRLERSRVYPSLCFATLEPTLSG